MGILNYTKWLKTNYANSFKPKWLYYYDHIYIDINYILHYVFYGTQNEEEIFYKFFSVIDRLLFNQNPIKSITFVGDGPAPLAKMLLQKKRRSTMTIKDHSPIIFSPNTIFMDTIGKKIEEYGEKIKKVFGTEVIIDINNVGEGELKIKNYLLKNLNNNDTNLIVSSDADVIVMCSNSDIQNLNYIYIMVDIKTTNILKLGDIIESHFKTINKSINYNDDFVLVSLLMGNDYLPSLSCSNLDNYWKAYDNLMLLNPEYTEIGLIDNEGNINKNVFMDYLIEVHDLYNKKYIFKYNEKYNNTNINKIYKNYLDGLTWCFHMYKNGQCMRYNYYYKYDISITPIDLINVISNNEDYCKLDRNVFEYENAKLYSYNIIPKSHHHLIL